MPDDPDESFVIHTVLNSRPRGAAPSVAEGAETLIPLAPGDDAACVPGNSVVTVDAMVEGVHWDDKLSPADVGWKLIAANASDINAMAAIPQWAVLTMCLPRPLDRDWVQQFASGLGEALEQWSIQLVGGDTTRSTSGRMLSLTMSGTTSTPVGRCGAKHDDDIWVSGPLGGAAAAFCIEDMDTHALRRPHPPVGLGHALGQAHLATSMMDLSDGLSRDLPRLCKASGVGAVIEHASLPAHASLQSVADPLPLMVGFGEEYELLFTASPHHRNEVETTGVAFGKEMTRIGTINTDTQAGPQLDLGHWPAPLFSHFEERA